MILLFSLFFPLHVHTQQTRLRTTSLLALLRVCPERCFCESIFFDNLCVCVSVRAECVSCAFCCLPISISLAHQLQRSFSSIHHLSVSCSEANSQTHLDRPSVVTSLLSRHSTFELLVHRLLREELIAKQIVSEYRASTAYALRPATSDRLNLSRNDCIARLHQHHCDNATVPYLVHEYPPRHSSGHTLGVAIS